MKILGIDPGSRRTGYGLLEAREGSRPRALLAGVWDLTVYQNFPDRLVLLEEELSEFLEEYAPDWISIERVFFALNAKSALLLGQVRGVILLAARRHTSQIQELSVTEVKKSVALKGRAGKEDVAGALSLRLQQSAIRTLPHDASDALSLAYAAALHLEDDRRLKRCLNSSFLPP